MNRRLSVPPDAVCFLLALLFLIVEVKAGTSSQVQNEWVQHRGR